MLVASAMTVVHRDHLRVRVVLASYMYAQWPVIQPLVSSIPTDMVRHTFFYYTNDNDPV